MTQRNNRRRSLFARLFDRFDGWWRAIAWLSVALAFGLAVLIFTGLLVPLAATGFVLGALGYGGQLLQRWRDYPRARARGDSERAEATWRRYQ